ncbi:MAG TPA: hypothetical protein V6D29_23555 [Leptolyngbyaceae cyanobacterium]
MPIYLRPLGVTRCKYRATLSLPTSTQSIANAIAHQQFPENRDYAVGQKSMDKD